MLTLLPTAERYLDIAKAEREAHALWASTTICVEHVEVIRARWLRYRELVAQREALAGVLELNHGTLEVIPLVPVEPVDDGAQAAPMPPEIHVYAVSGNNVDTYPDTFLLVLPPSADGGMLRQRPVATTLTREELADLGAACHAALLNGSVLGLAERVYAATDERSTR